jgi:hypothetical protein
MGPFGSRKLRTLFEATYFVGLRKAGMPEALTAPNSAGTRFEGPLMLCTRRCDLLEIELPIISAPTGPDLSSTDLVAAVCDAGGVVVLQA